MINLNQKIFKALNNSENGEVSSEVTFYYFQKENIVWGTYEGGQIIKGNLVGLLDKEKLTMTYQHLNQQNEFLSGKCETKISTNKEGKILLNERWQWTCKDFSKGTSLLIEQ